MAGNTTSTTTFRADISDLRRGMQEATRQIKLANSEFRAASAGLDDWTRSATGLSAKLRSLDTVLGAQRRQLSLLEDELQDTIQEYGENSAAADRLRVRINNQTAAIGRTEREIRDYQSQLDHLENEADSAAGEIDDMNDSLADTEGSAKKSSDGFTVLKDVLSDLVTDGIRMVIEGFKELAKQTYNAGANFEQEMANVGAISNATEEDMELLKEKAKEMGATTKFSASEAAEAFSYMAMAGWDTKDMLNGISGVMNLAAASGEDLSTTSDIVTDALTAMGYEAGDAGRLADVMASASANANTNVSLMGKTFQYAAPILGTLNMNMEDAAVAIGLMANSGIKGDKAGTALRATLNRLSAPPKECAREMERLNVSLTDSEGDVKSLNDVMKDLRVAFNDLSEEEQTSAAKHIAGQEAMSGLLAIVNASEEDFNKLTDAVNNSEGATEKMADKMNDTVSGVATLLKSHIEGVMIDAFEKIAPSLKNALQGASDALTEFEPVIQTAAQGFADWISSLSDTMEKVGDGTVAERAAKAVEIITTRIMGTFARSIPTMAANVAAFMDSFINGIHQIVPKLAVAVASIFPPLINESEKIAMNLIASLPSLFSTIVKAITSLIPQLTETIAKTANDIVKKIPAVLKNIVTIVPVIIKNISDAITKEGSVLTNSFVLLFNSFKTALPSILSMLAENLPSVIDSVIDFVIDATPALLDASIKMWAAFVDALPEVVPDILKGVVDVSIKTASTIASRLPDITNATVRMMQGVAYGIEKIVPKVIESIPKIYLAVTENLISAMPQVLDAAKTMLFGAIYAFQEILPTLNEKIGVLIDAVKSGFSNAASFLVDAGRDIVRGLWMGINDMVGWIKGKIQEFARGIVDTMKKAVKIGSPSKVMRDEVGCWMAMGIPAGFDKAYSSVAKRLSLTAKSLTGGFVASLVKGLYSTSGGISKISVNAARLAEQAMQTAVSSSDFSGAASTAATRFSDALEKKIDYFSKKIQYQNEQRISAFDDNIAELERRQDQETADEEAANSKRVERLKKERDAYVAKAEKRLKKEKDEKEKENINKEISIIKKRYEKLINAQENASKKQISATKKGYESLIKEQEKARASYEKASSEALEEFNDAMVEYKEKARSFIESSANGLADSFQQQYDALISKQDKLIDKLKTAGELFNVSNAGVITLNDIRQQTANIKEYAERLNQIKEKVSNELFQEITDYDMKEGNAFMKQLLSMSEDELAAYNEAYSEKMRLAEQVAEDLYQPDFENLSKDYEKSVEDMFTGLPDKLNELAKEAMAGFASGLLENTDYMEASVRKIISALVDEFKEGLDIHSPSKVLEKLGAFAVEGFADGLESVIGLVKESADELMNAVSNPLSGIKDGFHGALSGIASGGISGFGNRTNVVNNYSLIQNNTSPKSLSALETYQARRQQLAMLKTLTV